MKSKKLLVIVIIIIALAAAVWTYNHWQQNQLLNIIDQMNKMHFNTNAEKMQYIYQKIGAAEGGYVHDPSDAGQETYAGISRRYHPDWAGWAIIDRIKLTRKIKYNEHLPELDTLHLEFFQDEYYNKYKTYLIEKPGMQYLYLDIIWMSHWQQAADSIRQVFGITTKPIWELDGIKFFNDEAHHQALAQEITRRRNIFVENYAKSRPDQQKYLAGWKARFKSVLDQVNI